MPQDSQPPAVGPENEVTAETPPSAQVLPSAVLAFPVFLASEDPSCLQIDNICILFGLSNYSSTSITSTSIYPEEEVVGMGRVDRLE